MLYLSQTSCCRHMWINELLAWEFLIVGFFALLCIHFSKLSGLQSFSLPSCYQVKSLHLVNTVVTFLTQGA